MIKVLRDWSEIKEADKALSRNVLPKHGRSIEKNWDLYQLYTLSGLLSKGIKIIDLGCGELFALKLLYAMKFKNLFGIDLSMPLSNRLRQVLEMCKNRSLKIPFHLYRKDLIKTGFSDAMFDLAVCISVIEHGIDIENFFLESHRLLKPGGILFITTDYWEEKINIPRHNRPFNLEWKVFCKKEIEEAIGVAYKFKFSLYHDSAIPACLDRCVVWNNQEYTFLSLVFKKDEHENHFRD